MDAPRDVEKDWQKKQREFEKVKARAKALRLRLTCVICGEKAKLNCPCETTQYCSVACQKIDWRERGHRTSCKKIRDERAAEAARAEAPTPPPSPPRDVFYGPAPRSHADEVRARIAAEHEAARARREANPEPAPISARYGSRCPICLEEWDVNDPGRLRPCCCRKVCRSCENKIGNTCPLCRVPRPQNQAENLARIRRHVENDVPEAMEELACGYRDGRYGLTPNDKKSVKLWKRAVALGSVSAMCNLGFAYSFGRGVKMDKKKAMQLYLNSASRGCAIAMFNVADMFKIDENWEEAFSYYRRSAERGYADAIFNVGIFYLSGAQGVQYDLDEAKRWLLRAAAKGCDPERVKRALDMSASV